MPVAWRHLLHQPAVLMLTPHAQRVLSVLCQAADAAPGGTVPLRRIAVSTLGDWEEGLSALAALDDAGYIRGSIAGWIEGWVTERGRAASRV